MKLVLTIAATMLALPSATLADTRYALIVGHNLGDLNETPLRWAESDAERMRRVLTEIGDVRGDRTMLLLSPTVEEFEAARLTMEGRLVEAKARGERTIFMVYFSGHADQENLHFARETLSLETLEKNLRSGAATTVVQIVDACRNDRNPRVQTKGATRAPAFSWPKQSEQAPSGYVRLSSAAEGEVAQESDDLQGSLFTHHLLSGMRGSADLDQDGTVTLDELYRYGYARTLEDTHRQTSAVQHSELEVALAGRGALVLTYPRRAVATLEFPDDMRGHLLVIDDASGRIVAEVHKESGATRLAVAPGRYRIQLRGTSEIRGGLIALTSGNRPVKRDELEPQPILAVLRKGPSYDPHPFLLSLGTGVGRSVTSGFGIAPSITLGFDYRWAPEWRAGLRINTGYAGGSSRLWERRQLELGVALGVDYAGFVSEQFGFVVGLRGGVVGAVQDAERKDEDRLASVGLDDVSTTEYGLGPKVGAVIGLEYHPWSQVGLRIEGEPSLWWIPSDGETSTRWGITGTLALMVRL